MPAKTGTDASRFGTAPVFFTAISTILGAILFLRFGYAVGTLGFFGVLLIIIIGHLVTIPTALAISEIATNQKVEGGGEYFIISRSFGLNIGATIGIALFLSQAISVAFYIIAFTEAFTFLFEWVKYSYSFELPRQAISIPVMIALSLVIIFKGANIGVKALYIVVGILFISLVSFFMGSPIGGSDSVGVFKNAFGDPDKFFVVFAIIFPAFTGMTAGVGLSGDLKNPGKSIPLGTVAATISGFVIYIFIIHKLAISASPEELLGDQLVMSKITLFGAVLVPLGLAASTISSAIGSFLVAPRTLQALGIDKSFPLPFANGFLAKGVGSVNEPRNASIVVSVIALIFVMLGDVDVVATIITMFFMVTYGSLCLISFLYHFGADPSYRPKFRSRWYLSLLGFLICVILMFEISTPYALFSILSMVILYLYVNSYHKDRGGLVTIFQNAIFQLSRNVFVYLQKTKKADQNKNWRPSAVCVSRDSFERDKALILLSWISYRFGFGTYIHLIEGYYSKSNNTESKKVLSELINRTRSVKGNIYIDTIISPSFTSAIAQIVQLPSPSGMENNMIIFEYDKHSVETLEKIIDNLALIQAGDFDVCIMGTSQRTINYSSGIHIWLRDQDIENANLMILLSYILLGHPDWEKAFIKVFSVCAKGELEEEKRRLDELVLKGRLPIFEKNIKVIELNGDTDFKTLVNTHSADAGLTILGFEEALIKHEGADFFDGYSSIGDVLFVDAKGLKEL
ncbi:MAG: amino acid permease [Ignavibacteriales bacterium]|nr:MAG: amino acid permease [Ignavibacteriales bacterium]